MPSLSQRLTAKAGPLPVWAWAAVLLGAFLAYNHFHSSSSSTSTSSTGAGGSSTGTTDTTTDTTPVTSGDSSSDTGTGGGGGSASNVNDELLSQLSGFQSSIDSLTAAVQQSDGTGGLPGSGNIDWGIPGGVEIAATPGTIPSSSASPPAAPKPTAKVPPKPAAKVVPKKITYYTLKKNVPIGPGQSLHFTKGKGYYAA
jgi:hypothetical protein